jgi:hypothetical protein
VTDATHSRTPDSRPTGGLSAQYQPGEVEQRRYEQWVSAGYFTADPKSDKPPFSIVIPPPNVTGSLHIGHALDHTIQDTLSRLKRMQGFEVLWLPECNTTLLFPSRLTSPAFPCITATRRLANLGLQSWWAPRIIADLWCSPARPCQLSRYHLLFPTCHGR